jgi:hypothetical protein
LFSLGTMASFPECRKLMLNLSPSVRDVFRSLTTSSQSSKTPPTKGEMEAVSSGSKEVAVDDIIQKYLARLKLKLKQHAAHPLSTPHLPVDIQVQGQEQGQNQEAPLGQLSGALSGTDTGTGAVEILGASGLSAGRTSSSTMGVGGSIDANARQGGARTTERSYSAGALNSNAGQVSHGQGRRFANSRK